MISDSVGKVSVFGEKGGFNPTLLKSRLRIPSKHHMNTTSQATQGRA